MLRRESPRGKEEENHFLASYQLQGSVQCCHHVKVGFYVMDIELQDILWAEVRWESGRGCTEHCHINKPAKLHAIS